MLLRAQRLRDLDERERVSVGQLDQPLGRRLGKAWRPVGEQRPRSPRCESLDAKVGHPGRLERERVRLARGEENRDLFGVQPPRCERERLGRRIVEPVGVVDDAEQRPLFGGSREQAQHRRADGQAFRCRPFLDRERSPQRGRLRLRELVDGRHGRAQQLLRACECDLGFRFDAERAQDVEVAGSSHGMLEQRALADPRLAPKDEGGASPCASRVQQRVDARALVVAAEQHARDSVTPGNARTRDFPRRERAAADATIDP